MKLCVILPAHNEEKRLAPVAREVLALGFSVCVVDDGSIDGTSASVKDLPLHLIRLDPNRGKGGALRAGLDWAAAQNYDGAVLMDSDGQHLPSEIARFRDALLNSQDDFVIGNRMGNHNSMPLVRLWTNRTMSAIVSAVSGVRVPDCTCGFRAIRLQAYRKLFLQTNRYEIESEMILDAARKKLKIGSVPVSCVYGDEKSQIRPIADTWRFLKFLIKNRV